MTIAVTEIQRVVARRFGVPVSSMWSHRRHLVVVRPRQVAMALAHEMAGMSLPQVGAAFGGRDHTTVMHAIRTVAARSGGDEDFERRVDGCRQEIVSAHKPLFYRHGFFGRKCEYCVGAINGERKGG